MRFIFFFNLAMGILLLAQPVQAQPEKPAFLTYQHHPWVDSVLNTLTPDDRIAQLIAVAAYSNRDDDHKQAILRLIREHKIGGLVFFQGGPVREARLINAYQEASKVPLLIAMDAEWGLGMRLDSVLSYPYQMTLGAIRDNHLIYQMGATVARQLKRAGIHMNFAPVADVNNNAANPVINFRSFGSDRDVVTEKAIAYMKGMQDHGILTTAKHFPGHGDTDADSHYSLPQIRHTRARLDSVELYPFRRMIAAGVAGIMVAHLNVEALDSSGTPSTLSRPIVTNLLRRELGFEGLIVTDAMNMKGVTGTNPPGIVDRAAILAGNDMLEFTENVALAIDEIRKAVRQGVISQEEIDRRCRRMLAAKMAAGLHRRLPVRAGNIVEDLADPEAVLLQRKLMAAALTVLKNDGNLIPVGDLDTLRIASVSLGAAAETPFQKSLARYAGMDHYWLAADATAARVDSLREKLAGYNLVIAGIHDQARRPLNQLSMSPAVIDLVTVLSGEEHVIIAHFRNPYTLDAVAGIEKAPGLIVTYQDNGIAQDLAAQLIFGGIGATGRLPVFVGDKFPLGAGLDVTGGIRFSYTVPEDAGMNSRVLTRGIDSLVHQAINAKAIPGCQVLVARHRKIVFQKAYGLHTYSDTVSVKPGDLYDLASVTKISSALPALMKLYDEGKFRLDATLGDYLPKFARSNKADISMQDMLTHQGRLTPWIPFWKNTLRKNGSYKWCTIRRDSSARFPIKVRDNMYLHRRYPDRIVRTIRKSDLLPEQKYVYSDFFFILSPRVVESMIAGDFRTYLTENFYRPLGATSVTYNPFEKYGRDRIVPTEYDFYFRHQPIHGTVHDEGAIMLGGVSGHAGLFANANDLAKLMQMYLDMGTYGGRRYIREETLREFSRTRFPEKGNRRALGFDKPNLTYQGINNNTAEGAGPASFGHTGFTGTFAWMDPDSGLLYIFLSNRVLPTRDNSRLYQLNTRTQVQQVLYDAIDRFSTSGQ